MSKVKKSPATVTVAFAVVAVALVALFFLSVNLGSLQLTPMQLLRGLFVEYDPDVATVYDLRFPRIIISVLAGASLAVAGEAPASTEMMIRGKRRS